MTTTSRETNEQKLLWNGLAGRAWVDTQALMDSMLEPFQHLLLDETPEAADAVLDVGCGTGSTTLALWERKGHGTTTGIDISEPMLDAARSRALARGANVSFVLADAQTYAFEPGSFDAVVSRFGVMFFDDPVRAFANLRSATRAGGRLCFIAWRSAAENPFMTLAERVAAPLMPNLPVRRAGEPGQFAFGDRARVHEILTKSAWTQVQIRPVDVPCGLPERDLETFVTRLGPVGRLLSEVDSDLRIRVTERIRAAFAPYVEGAHMRFTAACWVVSAVAPGRAE